MVEDAPTDCEVPSSWSRRKTSKAATNLVNARTIPAALLAGSVAGVVMALFVMTYMAAIGRSVWTNPNLIAVMWLGEEAAESTFSSATVVGFVTHMITSAEMGLIAIPFIRDLPPARTVLVAFAYAVASYRSHSCSPGRTR